MARDKVIFHLREKVTFKKKKHMKRNLSMKRNAVMRKRLWNDLTN